MARLDARWGHFWQRGQKWYHFDQGEPLKTYEASLEAGAIILAPVYGFLTAGAILLAPVEASFSADAVIVTTSSVTSSFSAGAVIAAMFRQQHDRGNAQHHDHDMDTVIVLAQALGVYVEGQDLHSVLASIVDRVSTLESS